MAKKTYYTQFVNNHDEPITSAEVGIESKLFVTIVNKDTEVSDVKNLIEDKLKELSHKFELKKEYTTSNGNRGLFYVVPDIF
jgi:hypothetical protein